MDLFSQMAIFVRVVETGSLSAAARAEKLSLPAVSKKLRALEKELGASLIARSTRRLAVTDAGQRWYERCVQIMAEVADARDAVADERSVRGTLVVSAAITLGHALVVPKLAPLAKKHPKLSIELRLEDRLVDLASDAVDVAVRGGVAPPDSTRVVAHEMLTFRRVAVASPAYLGRRGAPKTPAELGEHSCLLQLGEGRAPASWSFARDGEDGVEQQRVLVRGAIRTNTPLAIRDLARDGAGIAFLPEWLVEEDLANKRLRRVLAPWRSEPVAVWAIYRSELRGSVRVRAFLSVMEGGPRGGARSR